MVFNLMQWFVATSEYFVGTFGYIGIFFIAMISAMSIFFPTFPLSILVFLSAAKFNPLLIGICAGLGSATGELTSFGIGFGSKKILLKKQNKKIKRIEKLFQKYKGRVIIFFFSLCPIIPIDVLGLFCGAIGYDIRKFFMACAAGKVLRYIIIAYTGFYSISWILEFLRYIP